MGDFVNMDKKQINASVLMPVYNAERYLEQAIESILNQSFRNFELLILNDGSTDGSEAIIDAYVAKDDRCKKLSWPNQGIIATLNKGLKEAIGEIIFRMDADDVCRPDRFEKQWNYLKKNPDCVAVGSKVLLIDSEGLPICEFIELEQHDKIDSENLKGHGSVITHPTVAMRKSSLMAIGGYRHEYPHAEDLDLFLRLAEEGKLANLPEVLLEYRQHASSIGYSKRAEQLASAKAAVLDAKQRRGLDVVDSTLTSNLFETPALPDVYRKWAWWALSGGNVKTARKYAVKALLHSPFNLNNARLLACVIRGY